MITFILSHLRFSSCRELLSSARRRGRLIRGSDTYVKLFFHFFYFYLLRVFQIRRKTQRSCGSALFFVCSVRGCFLTKLKFGTHGQSSACRLAPKKAGRGAKSKRSLKPVSCARRMFQDACILPARRGMRIQKNGGCAGSRAYRRQRAARRTAKGRSRAKYQNIYTISPLRF